MIHVSIKDPIVHFEMPAGSSTGGDPYYDVFTTDVDEKQQPKKPGAINGPDETQNAKPAVYELHYG